jgi:hypothetical protein
MNGQSFIAATSRSTRATHQQSGPSTTDDHRPEDRQTHRHLDRDEVVLVEHRPETDPVSSLHDHRDHGEHRRNHG